MIPAVRGCLVEHFEVVLPARFQSDPARLLPWISVQLTQGHSLAQGSNHARIDGILIGTQPELCALIGADPKCIGPRAGRVEITSPARAVVYLPMRWAEQT